MYPQIVKIWKDTRNLPEEQRTVVNQLFSFIEKLTNQDEIRQQADARYYQPNWFNDARIQ